MGLQPIRMKSLLLTGLLILSGAQAVKAEGATSADWVKVGEVRGSYVRMDGYIKLSSIKHDSTKYTYLSSWRSVDRTGEIIGDPNNWSNAKEGSGNCAGNETSDIRKKIKEYACKGIAVSQAQKQEALDEDVYEVNIDPMNDRKNIYIYWDAIEDDDATIIIRCKSGKLDAYIHTDTYNSDNDQIFIRWSDGTPLKETWNPSKDNDSFFAPSPYSFIQKIQRHETMAFQWEPYSTAPKARKFELEPLRRYLSKMENDGCAINFETSNPNLLSYPNL